MADNPLTAAPLPPVQRLSRAVLLVAAGLVTVTLLAVAFLATPKVADLSQTPARQLTTGDPGFLQHPPATPPQPNPEIAEQEYFKRLWAGLRHPAPGEAPTGPAGNPAAPLNPDAWPDLAVGGVGGIGGVGGVGAPNANHLPAGAFDPAATAPPAPPSPPRDPRREAFLRALRAPLAPPTAAPPPPTASPWPPLPAPEALGIRPLDATLLSDPRGANSPLPIETENAAENPPSLATERRRALGPGAPAAASASLAAAAPPAGRTAGLPAGRTAVLPAGTVVPALLLTAVNSDLPGTLIAQVSRNVYDLHQRAVVLPRGTRLLGRYGNQVAVGQQRLLVAWTRLQLLDGTLLDLPGLAGPNGAAASDGSDIAGAAGLPAQVQNHILRVFGDAILLSLLAAGADLSQPTSSSALTAPSAGSVASAALGQQLSAAGTQLLRRDLAIQPTLTLPAGTPLTVFVNADLPLPAPAPPAPPATRALAQAGDERP
jgi:type IV secretory pathway VirB10-like protein